MFEFIQRYKWWLLLIIALGSAVALFERYQTWREDSQDLPILAAATKYHVDPALVKAVVWRESKFNPRAKGRKKERGLMQIQVPTAEDWAREEHALFFTPDQLFDPAKNTLIGSWYLRKLLGRYQTTDNPIVYALADYNAGRANVLKWNKGAAATSSQAFLEQMDFPTTREYIRSILKRCERYRKVFPPKH